MTVSERVLSHLHLLAREQRTEHKLRHVFRQRSNGSENQSGWSAKKDSDGQGLVHALGFVEVEAAAFVNLKVHPSCTRVVKLHTINAQIVFARAWVLRINERKREERTAILLPCRYDRQFIKPRRFIHNLRDGRAAGVSCSEFQSFQSERAVLPELCRARWKKRFGNLRKLAHQILWLSAEGTLYSLLSAE